MGEEENWRGTDLAGGGAEGPRRAAGALREAGARGAKEGGRHACVDVWRSRRQTSFGDISSTERAPRNGRGVFTLPGMTTVLS
jgi:hypothetical protein